MGLRDLERWELDLILDRAFQVRKRPKDPHELPLAGKTVVLFFVEPSTRTRISFEIAARRLGANVLALEGGTSSLQKGETLLDTVRNLQAFDADIVVLRHWAAGTPTVLARRLQLAVVNAGDGAHEHPTQALADLFTIRDRLGQIEGVRVTIVGDILYSRVARSNLWGLLKYDAKVTLVGPRTLLPRSFGDLPIRLTHSLEEGVEGAQVILLLRIQHERHNQMHFPSLAEYVRLYQLRPCHLKKAHPELLIMHPGPVHRNVELSDELFHSSHSVILEQAANGITVRTAILEVLAERLPAR